MKRPKPNLVMSTRYFSDINCDGSKDHLIWERGLDGSNSSFYVSFGISDDNGKYFGKEKLVADNLPGRIDRILKIDNIFGDCHPEVLYMTSEKKIGALTMNGDDGRFVYVSYKRLKEILSSQ